MNKELDALLCKRYPLIFAERRRSIQHSCMGWGFSCGDGWFSLIDMLCRALQFSTDRNQAPQVVATQVKEKWGALSFYAKGANEWQRGAIAMAEAMSGRICEECGQPGRLLVDQNGVFLARCSEHAPDRVITPAEYHARRAGSAAPQG